MKDKQAQSKHFSSKVVNILTSASGKRIIPCYDNKNFYVYHSKKDLIEGVYIAHHSEEVKEITWLT